MENYDYIFTGGGCAALCTAWYMNEIGLNGKKVLIIDQEEKNGNDRTWCYWSKDDEHPFPELVSSSWSNIAFADDQGLYQRKKQSHQYNLIRSKDFYQHLKDVLKQNPDIDFYQGRVEHIVEQSNEVKVWVNGEVFSATKVFNSIPNWKNKVPGPNEYFLKQHFMGWFIESEEASFDPNQVVLMDFRTPQHDQARFFYILPFSKHRALVEFTVFSKDLLKDIQYRAALVDYIKEVLGINTFVIEEEEYGVIPMTNIPFIDQHSERIIPIGTTAGWVKPTTGYAFLNIIENSKTTARATLLGTSVDHRQASQARFSFYDNLLLHILTNEGESAKRIFSKLFRNNPMDRILTFLRESSHLGQEVAIFTSLPFKPFLKALWKRSVVKWLGQGRKQFRPAIEKK